MEFSGYLEVRTVSLVHITYVENFGERERERGNGHPFFLLLLLLFILDAMKIKES